LHSKLLCLLAGAAVAAFAVLAGLGRPLGAVPAYLDGIVAQVGQEVVLASEVDEQLSIASLRMGIPDSSLDRAREEILQRIIDEKVIVQEARARGVTVSDEEVQQAVAQHIEGIQNQIGGAEAFEQELAKEGLTRDELVGRYREEARRELLYTRLIQREIYSKIEITDVEVDEYYLKHRSELPRKQGQVELAHVFIGFRPDERELAAVEQKVQTVLQRLNGGESFGTVASALSDDPGSREHGGDLGWFARGDLDPRLAEVASKLEPGQLSDPFQTPQGIELLRLKESDGERLHLEHILVALKVSEEAKRQAHEKADQVHELAAGGKDFAGLSDEYSDDRQSAAKGGHLGSFAESELNPTIAGAIRGLKPGDLSEVVPSDQGFHVFKLIKREGGGEYELGEIRDRLKTRMVEERAAKRTESWLSGVRSRYFIRRADQERPPVPAPGGRRVEVKVGGGTQPAVADSSAADSSAVSRQEKPRP
jgi:peptidyl-prolyl cis-trans isomerase SurA